MDPITLATVTAAVSVLGAEVAKGFASNAGKDLWSKVKSALGWKSEPPPEEMAPTIAKTLQADAAIALKLIELLKQSSPNETFANSLVQSVSAEKVIVAGHIAVSGNLQM
jgi:hypothetical protein